MLPLDGCFVEAAEAAALGGAVGLVRAFCCRAKVFGERLRDRARFSREESEESEEGDSGMEFGEVWRFRAAERVMGAK